jgi:hypothetical protein
LIRGKRSGVADVGLNILTASSTEIDLSPLFHFAKPTGVVVTITFRTLSEIIPSLRADFSVVSG